MENPMLHLSSLILSVLMSGDAHALSCEYGFSDSIPADMSVDVPTNVTPYLMFAGGVSDLEFSLVHLASGELVRVEAEALGNQDIMQVRPQEELQPNSQYELRFINDEYQMYPDTVTFTTGAEADLEAPEAPQIIDIERDYGWDMWGSWRWLDIELAPASAQNIYRLEVADNENFANSEIIYTESYDSIVSIGQGLCAKNMQKDARDVKWVKVSTLDLAGNSSGALEAFQRGCSSASQPANVFFVLFSLPLLVLRRRQDPV